MMDLNSEQRQLTKLIDDHVKRFPDNDVGNKQLLKTLDDYLEPFKVVMDTSTRVQVDYLSLQYPGFYRFGKVLGRLAKGISDGVIDMPQ